MVCEVCEMNGEQALAWFALVVVWIERERNSRERLPLNFNTRRLAPDSPKTYDESVRMLEEIGAFDEMENLMKRNRGEEL